ncbi:arylamine N-acetyltransferase family protein [Polyangium aurulentum]|uniref:arylamine N-acetyltransferase family protein n=1 Tax=Polyangium aurulentum TaxID=2567896 RepID=UPI0010ADC63C|nr:arylamine N-acetyltransferase [Polyangium aurulentum]UQA58615.1 arylamine N-acetyltransferase [Polyangium aurulentum]
MRVTEDPELSGWLSRSEAAAFCERIGSPCERPDLQTLRRLLRAYLGRIPFQNVNMLARYGRAPAVAEILEDMRRGAGGPCNVMNPFLAALLARMGYDVALSSGSMAQPDCHIALSVRLEGRTYWLDAGNGHPYLEPVAFGDQTPRFHAGLTFRLATRGSGVFAVEHLFADTDTWKTSYTLTLEPRPLRFFAAMIEQHHTEPEFGPFLSGLRLVRFPDGALTAIRDDVLLTGRASLKKVQLNDRRALFGAIAQHFGDVDLPIGEALRALERAGRPLFDPAPSSPGTPP